MKTQRINIIETKIGTILGEINPEEQTKSRMLPATREIHRSTILTTLVTIFITIRRRNWECLVGVAHV